MSRIACFSVPMFPLAARLRCEPELLQEAVAVVEGNGNSAHVVAATRRARSKGIRPGHSLAQARSIVPKLIARGRDNEAERTAQEALLEIAETFSPRVEDAGEGVVFVDIAGLERHWGEAAAEASGLGPRASGESDAGGGHEVLLGRAAMRRCEAIGLPVRVGIAASKLAARVAAELAKSPTVVAAGNEAGFLAPLPLTRLSPELGAATTLHRWGITSIGDLAGLPESEVASRLGELGRELHYAARGIDPRPLIPRPLPPDFREGMELEWPLVALEPFLFIANAALDRLSKRLETVGFSCTRLELTLTLEPDGFHVRAIELPAPTRDVKTMLTLLRLDLEKTPPGAPVTGFSLVAHPDRPRRAQLSLFGPAALSPERLATTIARLISILGDGRVGMAMPVDGHLPERYAIADYAPPPPPTTRPRPKKSRGLLAVRVFRPPVPVEVNTHVIDGETQIAAIHGEGDHAGEARVSSGPWRIEEGWWAEKRNDREYWDAELTRGGIYRLYRDRVSGEWFLDARYD
ncbi:MAG TPA: DNA polymerase Y family protein [Thermoanaerobaculia bacterium]|nr:DNA polymerase Y family protein [Thermoanaerobaculia bacterium]